MKKEMGEPFVALFSKVDYPILTGTDVAKGMWRGAIEGFRGRPTKSASGHALSQTIGSAMGRMVDTQDDRTGIVMLQGSNMVVKAMTVSLVTGGIDTAMGRGGKFERFVIPVLVDSAVDLVASKIYNNNPRIL
jgi:hypothetical protein